MAINPGSDLLNDALMAAEPQRAKSAAERLASLAVSGDSAAPAFEVHVDDDLRKDFQVGG